MGVWRTWSALPSRDPKVDQHRTSPHQNDVRRLHIHVQQADPVDMHERAADVDSQAQGIIDSQTLVGPALHELVKIGPLQEFHQHAIEPIEAEAAHHVWMRGLEQDARLAPCGLR